MSVLAETKFVRFLKTPEDFSSESSNADKLKTNLNTDLLKLIAIISMLCDHIGAAFFPDAGVFRWIGRLAFPIFCYCMTVGLIYTSSVKKYLARLGIFALVSQPFFVLAFHPYDWQAEWSNMNIYFTLAVSLLAMTGFKERKWLLFAVCFLLLMFFNFDYGTTGVILMLIFYICRNRPGVGALVYCIYYLPSLWSGDPADPRSIGLGSLCIDWTAFCLLAAVFIFPKFPRKDGKDDIGGKPKSKFVKYFFYIFYPAHLAVIGAVRLILGV